ncbi:unnamed protein product [Periconia digitata]|uniref:Uncharacterized protein n=1 Tax=Periconia digitata TaxID=1303443 RepID=A0A9W4US08_9PLEO|nr:unnamed protein product [Periconia digitata]
MARIAKHFFLSSLCSASSRGRDSTAPWRPIKLPTGQTHQTCAKSNETAASDGCVWIGYRHHIGHVQMHPSRNSTILCTLTSFHPPTFQRPASATVSRSNLHHDSRCRVLHMYVSLASRSADDSRTPALRDTTALPSLTRSFRPYLRAIQTLAAARLAPRIASRHGDLLEQTSFFQASLIALRLLTASQPHSKRQRVSGCDLVVLQTSHACSHPCCPRILASFPAVS